MTFSVLSVHLVLLVMCAGIGLVIVDASVWQMLRGSIIVFTGILSVVFLKRKLKLFHWVGVSVVVVGTSDK